MSHKLLLHFTTLLSCLLMASLLTALPASAQLNWEATDGPFGGRVQALLATPDGTLYAGTEAGGVWRSEDKGNTWTDVNKGLTYKNVTSLAVSGKTLYAGTVGSQQIQQVEGASPASATSAKIDLSKGGLFRSEDKGNTWTEVNVGATHKQVLSVAVSDATLYVGSAGVYFGGGVFSDGVRRSVDEGKTWTTVRTGFQENLNVRLLSVSFDKMLYAGISAITAQWAGQKYPGGLFRSVDEGDNWLKLPFPEIADLTVNSLAVSGKMLYAGTNAGVFRSGDRGNSWTEVNKGLTNKNVTSLAVSGTTLYAGTQDGVFHSQDEGNTWTAVNTGLAKKDITALTVSGTTLYAGTGGAGGSVFRAELAAALPSPTLSITAPTPNQVLSTGTTQTTLQVNIQNHTGHWHWQLNTPFPSSGAAGGNVVASGNTATITGLTSGQSYTVYAALVDSNHNVLSPSVTQSVAFSVAALVGAGYALQFDGVDDYVEVADNKLRLNYRWKRRFLD